MSEIQTTLYPDFQTEIDQLTSEPTWVLDELEVFNWGPFSGLHRADFDPVGTAIIGPTGSGKTTLVDALMTLLVSQPRYNLASTGGHESDRTLISYVRGVLRSDGSEGHDYVARPGKTMTGICATYRAGEETLRLAGLMWTDGTSNAAKDLKRRWLFSRDKDQTLATWLKLLHEESARELMRVGRETAGLRIFDGSKKAFLAHTRKFFDVGKNAFTLLNRAAGLKQLNSIDEIFRELVLDDRTAFDRALEVASEFDNLDGIHAELQTARRQQQTLVPVKTAFEKLEKSRQKTKKIKTLKRILPIWFAIIGESVWSDVIEAIEKDRETAQHELNTSAERHKDVLAQVETLREQYLQLGGNVVGELENSINALTERVNDRKRNVEDYRKMIRQFDLSDELNESTLARNQAALVSKREQVQKLRDEKQEETLSLLSKQRDGETKAGEVENELRKIKSRPGSNIPARFQDFRAALADQLNLQDTDLPYLAELIEVKSDESDWRGAIERAVGSERLRVLVPERQMRSALQWINGRDNRLHVRLQEAKANESGVDFFADGFTRKLNFKSHPLENAARKLLSRRDLHCVESAEALRQREHGLTIEGMMSGRKGRFEKQDNRRLNENWMTGFDNKDQLNFLTNQLLDLHSTNKSLNQKATKLKQQLGDYDNQLKLIEALSELKFAKIDLPSAESELQRTADRLAAMLDPNSDASKAKLAYDERNKELKGIDETVGGLNSRIAVLDDRLSNAQESLEKTTHRKGNGLNEEETVLAEKSLPVPNEINSKQLDKIERDAAKKVDDKLGKILTRITDDEKRVVREMEKAKREDTGALTDTGSELEDVPAYLERLQVLSEEALPEKLKRFLKYLNKSSDQGVTQLLARIDEEVDVSEHRIADLNLTLLKVDFRDGRYLQLKPQRIKHERLRSLESALRRLRGAALKDDEGESHYKALRDLVAILREAGENRRLQGSRALLDPRYRLEFYVVEVDRQTGNHSQPRTGSQGGSGGEKELMASHILTASLSYALCPTEADRPLYGTVILDEAFSKSSPSAATQIIEALRIFGLHPIFVTPNKEIGLLKRHTKKVICVQRPGKQASLASISWEKLEGLARLR